MAVPANTLLDQLDRSLAAVGVLTSTIRPEQWALPTPCAEWTVRELVDHLVGMNRVFVALLADEPPPRRRPGAVDEDLALAYRESAAALLGAFSRPGTLDRSYRGPLGVATGAQRLQIRLYDVLAHGWDLARALGQPAQLPEDAAEQALAFARGQIVESARPGRFGPAQDVSADAPAIERLVAFLGRPVGTTAGGTSPPSDEPGGGTSPPSDQPAAGTSPPSEEPGGGTSPPSDQPAAGTSPPSDEPAGGTSPASDQPAAGTSPPSDEPGGGTSPPSERAPGGTSALSGRAGDGGRRRS